MANEKGGRFFSILRNNFVSVSFVLVILLVIIPIPKQFIDLSMILNLSLSIIVLLVVLSNSRPADFQVYPRIVLFQTLFSLGINVSSTRLILNGKLSGGQLQKQSAMVQAFADLVAGNELVVGFIIFIIIIVVQVLVVTKGSDRVAEVAARFSLDSMNNKMFAIQDRVQSGEITPEEGQRQKALIEREIDFYSSMDGATKFVSGNVKAGIFITVINLIGGFIIGMAINHMDFQAALSTYSKLTIGDGLTSQLPSLIISVATGLLITGTKSDENITEQIKSEFTTDGRIYEIVGLVLVVAGIVLRNHTQFILIPVGVLFFYIGFRMTKDQKKKEEEKVQQEAQKKESSTKNQPDEKYIMLDPLTLELGYALIPLVDKEKGAELLERIYNIRNAARLDMGFDIPPIRIIDNMTIEPNDYIFKIQGIEAGRASIKIGYLMCMDTGSVITPLEGEKTKDPAFGINAIWVPESQRSEAEQAGYIVVDPPNIISTHITEIIRAHAAQMLDRQAVANIIDKVKENNKVLVQEVLETAHIPYGVIQSVLQNLLSEQVSIRNYVKILETMANYSSVTNNVWLLTKKVREALGLQICSQYAEPETNILRVCRISQDLVELIGNHAYIPQDGSKPTVNFDPVDSRKWIKAVNATLAKLEPKGILPIILAPADVRQLIRSSLEKDQPGVVVISDMELSEALQNHTIKVEVIDEIKVEE